MRYTPLRALRITYDLFYPAFLLFFVGNTLLFLIPISSFIFFSLFLYYFLRVIRIAFIFYVYPALLGRILYDLR
jgi:hypothetical protein